MTLSVPRLAVLMLTLLIFPVLARADHVSNSRPPEAPRSAASRAVALQFDPCRSGNCGLVFGGRGGGSLRGGGLNLKLGSGLGKRRSSWNRRGRGGRSYGRSGRGRRGFRRRR